MYTDKLFTGQREMAGLGIYHYGARFYSPKLGRFLSADTIVPGYANPQNLNRFSYVRNNPLRYTDPTGHLIDEGCGCANTGTIRRTGITVVAGRPTRNSDSGRTFVPVNNTTPNILVPVPLINVPVSGGSEPHINIPDVRDNGPYINVPDVRDNGPYINVPVSGGPIALINVSLDPEDTWNVFMSTDEELSEDEDEEEDDLRFDDDQDALIQLARDARNRGGLTANEAETLLNWAEEYDILPISDGIEVHPDRNFNVPHIRIGPINHIPVREV